MSRHHDLDGESLSGRCNKRIVPRDVRMDHIEVFFPEQRTQSEDGPDVEGIAEGEFDGRPGCSATSPGYNNIVTSADAAPRSTR
jgi:hypothetical protein